MMASGIWGWMKICQERRDDMLASRHETRLFIEKDVVDSLCDLVGMLLHDEDTNPICWALGD